MRPFLKSVIFVLTLTSAMSAQADILPAFHGTWVGTCDYTQIDGTNEVYSLTIVIAPVNANEVTWNLTYVGPSGTIIKNYNVRGVDVAANRYVLDENNGILIDEYLYGGTRLVESFDVSSTTGRLTASTEVNGTDMRFDNIAFSSKLIRRTRAGGTTVSAYPATSLESCDLVKQ